MQQFGRRRPTVDELTQLVVAIEPHDVPVEVVDLGPHPREREHGRELGGHLVHHVASGMMRSSTSSMRRTAGSDLDERGEMGVALRDAHHPALEAAELIEHRASNGLGMR